MKSGTPKLPKKLKFDRNAYQRAYMRKKKVGKRNKSEACVLRVFTEGNK